MEKRYEHQKFEGEVYRKWEESGAFSPLPYSEAKGLGKKAFTIIMPPPNANDPLHVGHAMFVSIEDILVRYHRMSGDDALWLPGTDHAGIETQYVFEKKLAKEGKSRFQFDRETLYQMIWEYVQENSQVALSQMKKLGASADWSRTKFTLEPEIVDLVLNTFETMHKEGLIYRDLRLVNYCSKCGTGYSELEILHEERGDPLYYLKYGPFELATVRPETKFGDTAVAVNPKDERYKEWIGKEIEVEGLLGTFRMKVVGDEYVDPEFGTGVVKITPAHDFNDFEVGKRHGLEIKQVIGFDGKLNEIAGKYQGLRVTQAREQVVADLQAKGLLVKTDEAYRHSVAMCYRCGGLIEPLPLPQFFISVKLLTEKALEALSQDKVAVHGAGHDKILKHWLINLKDWNISRQIVWGIRMPVWYRVATGDRRQVTSLNSKIMVGFLDGEKKFVSGEIRELLATHSFEEIERGLQTLMAPKEAPFVVSREKPESEGLWLQETDTFDTWFSSAQWPVVTLLAQKGDRRQATGDKLKTKYTTEDFERFYPTSVMNTGYDILPFWVMRMLLMGLYLTGEVPFEQVYFHGLVRDEKGQKMSKSKGNVINPLLLVDKYGADALRMALVMSTTPGLDSSVGDSKVRGMRNLANKVWNAARFIKLQATSDKLQTENTFQTTKDKEFSERLKKISQEVTTLLDELKIGLAAETVHNEFWHWWCDEVLESYKRQKTSYKLIEKGMRVFLKLLHPFVPFVTEAVWSELGYDEGEGLLIQAVWPKSQK